MKEKSAKINYRPILVATMVAVLIFGAVYWTYYTYETNNLLTITQNNLASSTAVFQSIVSQQRAKIALVTSENQNLSNMLTTEQKARFDLEQQKQANLKQIDTLTKLTTIDPELIKKYSKVYFLSENYVPAKLTDIPVDYLSDPTKPAQFLENAYPFFLSMLQNANASRVPLFVVSAYRSFDYQKTLKSDYKVIYGAGTANQFSADQGYSEHQLGTAVDFGTTNVGADLKFEKSAAFKWLSDNAYKYGFVISYPKSNTYYEYEPWHWRFVGRQLAQDLHDQGKYFYEMDQRTIDTYLIKLFD